jgi:hypothetical protein
MPTGYATDPMKYATHQARRCRAHSRGGKPCGLYPIRGGLVCHKHGGSAIQVKRAARQRLLEAADPAAARLAQLVDSEDEAIALYASKALLDRAGYGPSSTQVQVDGGQVNYQIAGVDLDQL